MTRSETASVGVFDSGVGGLTVLRAIRRALPRADLCYLADTAFAPYGERDDDFVRARGEAVAQALVDLGAGALVVACNTATAAAVERLRQRWPDLPVIGVEPGVKPALAASPRQRIAVMATPATLASRRFARLLERHAGRAFVHLEPCPGLAAAIERSADDATTLAHLIEHHGRRLRDADVDAVVLGCTHYPLVADRLARWLPAGTAWIDTGEAVARQVARRAGALAASAGTTRLWSSGPTQPLAAMAGLALGGTWPVAALEV